MTPRTTDDTSGLRKEPVSPLELKLPGGGPLRRTARKPMLHRPPTGPGKSGGKPCGTTSSATSTGRTTPRHLTGQAFPVYSAAPVPTEEPRQGKLVQASGSHMHHRVRPLTELADDRSKSPIHGLRLRT